MAKEGKPKFDYEIIEVLGTVTPTEDLRTPIIKGVLRTLWKTANGDEEEGIDIRRFNRNNNMVFGGIRLTIEEAHRVCNILLDLGYGSTENIEAALEKRKDLTGSKPIPDEKGAEDHNE